MKPAILSTLQDQVGPAHAALVVVDPQKDFCDSEGAMARVRGLDMSRIQATVPALNAFIQTARREGVFVVWVREVRPENRMLPAHKAIHGVGDARWLIREDGDGIDWYKGMIKPLPDEPVLTKWDYDAFENTDFHLMLQSRGILTLLMTGFATNVCVETTARHGYIKGYYIVLVSDCTNAVDPSEYEATLTNIRKYFGKVATSAEIAAIWAA